VRSVKGYFSRKLSLHAVSVVAATQIAVNIFFISTYYD
jgi:hypothetical protein